MRKRRSGLNKLLMGGAGATALVLAMLLFAVAFKDPAGAGIPDPTLPGAAASVSGEGRSAEAGGAASPGTGASAILSSDLEGLNPQQISEMIFGQGAANGTGGTYGQEAYPEGAGISEAGDGQSMYPGQGLPYAAGEGAGTGSQPAISGSLPPEVTQEMTVHFLDVGQGDCTLILCGGEAMLIDAGKDNQGMKIRTYLEKQGVSTLKYVVCTHPDEDHIGGMDVILYNFNCETVLMTEENKNTKNFEQVTDTMAAKGYRRTSPAVGDEYLLGDASFTVLGPADLGNDSNNNSIALILTHGENRFLFTGDAEEEEEEDIAAGGIFLSADVYKVGHHGSKTSSSRKLLEAVFPTYAVISCGEGNSYGHPHAETMNALRGMGVQVFRTDEQGSIIAVSDGSSITWNCSPSDTWKAGEPTGSSGDTTQNAPSVPASGTGNYASGTGSSVSLPETVTPAPEIADPTAAPAEDSGSYRYICNTNTGKFHYFDCRYVDQMNEENKYPTNATREEIIGWGYDACKVCKP